MTTSSSRTACADRRGGLEVFVPFALSLSSLADDSSLGRKFDRGDRVAFAADGGGWYNAAAQSDGERDR